MRASRWPKGTRPDIRSHCSPELSLFIAVAPLSSAPISYPASRLPLAPVTSFPVQQSHLFLSVPVSHRPPRCSTLLLFAIVATTLHQLDVSSSLPCHCRGREDISRFAKAKGSEPIMVATEGVKPYANVASTYEEAQALSRARKFATARSQEVTRGNGPKPRNGGQESKG